MRLRQSWPGFAARGNRLHKRHDLTAEGSRQVQVCMARMRAKLTHINVSIANNLGADLFNEAQAELKKIRAGT